jgi:hypothetical protein
MKFSIDIKDEGLEAFNVMVDFVRELMLSSRFMCTSEEFPILDMVFQKDEQMENPHLDRGVLNRIAFEATNQRNGRSLSIVHNSPVEDRFPFYSLGEGFEVVSVYQILAELLGR